MRAVTSLRAVRRWGLPVAAIVVVAVAVGVGVRGLYVPQKPVSSSAAVASTSLAPSAQPGSPVVHMSPDAAAHPDAVVVNKLLQTFFDSINNHAYDRWKAVVSSRLAAELSLADWQKVYATTQDGSVLVHRIEPASDGALRVFVTLTSTQSLEDAPPSLRATCVHWRLVYQLVRQSNALKVDISNAQLSPC